MRFIFCLILIASAPPSVPPCSASNNSFEIICSGGVCASSCLAGFTPSGSTCSLNGANYPICLAGTASFRLVLSSSSAVVGQGINVRVTAYLQNGSVSTGESRQVILLLTGPGGNLASYPASLINGVGTVNVSSQLAGSAVLSLSGSDYASSVFTGATASVTFTAGAASSYSYSAVSTSNSVGSPLILVVNTFDPFGNLATIDSRNCQVSMTASISATPITCPPSGCSTVIISGGIGNLSVGSTLVQQVTISVTCGSLSGSSRSVTFTFTPGFVAYVKFMEQRVLVAQLVGSSVTITVNLVDVFGNVASSTQSGAISPSVTVSSSSCGLATSIPTSQGTGSGSIFNTKTGICSFVASVTGYAFTGNRLSVPWISTNPAAFKITKPIGNTISGSVDSFIAFEAILIDQFGNTVDAVQAVNATVSMGASTSAELAAPQRRNPLVGLTFPANSGSVTFALLNRMVETFDFQILGQIGISGSDVISVTFTAGVTKAVRIVSLAPNLVQAGNFITASFQAIDQYNNPTSASGRLAQVRTSSSALVTGSILNFAQGTATCTVVDTFADNLTVYLVRGTAGPGLDVSSTASAIVTPSIPAALVLELNATIPVTSLLSVWVSVQDTYGNKILSISGWSFTLNVMGSSGPIQSPHILLSNGVGSADLSFTALGYYDITLVDNNSRGLRMPTVSRVLVVAGSGADYIISGFPTSAVSADSGAQISVEAIDFLGNFAADFTGVPSGVSLTVLGGPCTTGPGLSFQHGRATGLVSASLLASNPQNCSIGVMGGGRSPSPVTVSFVAGNLKQVLIATSLGAGFAAGSSLSVQFQLADQFGNPIYSDGQYAVIVPVSSVLSATPTRLVFTAGIAIAEFSSNIAGTWSFNLVAGSTKGSRGLTFPSDSLTVHSSDPFRVGFTLGSTSASVDAGVVVNVRLLDEFGNIVNGGVAASWSFSAVLTLSGFSPGNGLPFTLNNGIGTVTVPAQIVGSYSVSLTNPNNYRVSLGPGIGVMFTAGVSQSFSLSGPRASVSADAAAQLTVNALDQYGNLATGGSGLLPIGLGVRSGACSVSLGALSFVNGIASSSATITGFASGTDTDSCIVGLTGTSTDQQVTINWTSGVVSKVGLTNIFPTTVGERMNVTAFFADAYGNPVTSSDISRTVCLSASGALWSGPVITECGSVSAVGNPTFFIQFSTGISGAYSLSLVSSNPPVTLLNSPTLPFTPIQRAQCTVVGCFLSLTAEAASFSVDEGVALTVTATDSYGNVVNDFSETLSLSIVSGLQASLSPSANCPLAQGICGGLILVHSHSPGSVQIDFQGPPPTGFSFRDPVMLTAYPGRAVTYKFIPDTMRTQAGESVDVSLFAIDQFGNHPLIQEESSVSLLIGDDIQREITLVRGSASVPVRSTVKGEGNFTLFNSTNPDITNNALSAVVLHFEVDAGRASQWLVTGKSIYRPGELGTLTFASADVYGNSLGETSHANSVNITGLYRPEDDDEFLNSTIVQVEDGAARFEVFAEFNGTVVLTAFNVNDSTVSEPYVTTWRNKVNPPSIEIVEVFTTPKSASLKVDVSEPSLVTCQGFESGEDTYDFLVSPSWQNLLNGGGTSSINDGSGVVVVNDLQPARMYTIYCQAADLLVPPNVIPFASVLRVSSLVRTPPLPPIQHSKSMGSIVGAAVVAVLLIALIVLFCYRRRHNKTLTVLEKERAINMKMIKELIDDPSDEETDMSSLDKEEDMVKAEAEAMQKRLMFKLTSANTQHESVEGFPGEASEPVNPTEPVANPTANNIKGMLGKLGNIKFASKTTGSFAEVTDTKQPADPTGLDGFAHDAFDMLKKLAKSGGEPEIAAWKDLLEKRGKLFLDDSELAQLKEVGDRIIANSLRKRQALLEKADSVEKKLADLVHSKHPNALSDLLAKQGSFTRQEESQALIETEREAQALIANENKKRAMILADWKGKLGSAEDPESRDQLQRYADKAIEAFDKAALAERMALQNSLIDKTKARAQQRASKNAAEVEKLFIAQNAETVQLESGLASLKKGMLVVGSEGEDMIDLSALEAAKIRSEKERLEAQKKALAAALVNSLKARVKDGSHTEDEKRRLGNECELALARIAEQADKERAALEVSLKAKFEERKLRNEQLRKSRQTAESVATDLEIASSVEVQRLRETQTSKQVGAAINRCEEVAKQAVQSSLELTFAVAGLEAAATSQLGTAEIKGVNAEELNKMKLELNNIKTSAINELQRHADGQMTTLNRSLTRQEKELERSLEREKQRLNSVNAKKLTDVEDEVRRLNEDAAMSDQHSLQEDLSSKLDAELASALEANRLAHVSAGDVGGSAVEKQLRSVLNESERISQEQIIRNEFALKRKLVDESVDRSSAAVIQSLDSTSIRSKQDRDIAREIADLGDKTLSENIKEQVSIAENSAAQLSNAVHKRKLEALVSGDERSEILNAFEQDIRAAEMRLEEEALKSKEALNAKAGARKQAIEQKKQALELQRKAASDTNSRKIQLRFLNALSSIGQSKQLKTTHAAEVDDLKRKHEELEKELRQQMQKELAAMAQKLSDNQEKNLRMKKLGEAAKVVSNKEELSTIKETMAETEKEAAKSMNEEREVQMRIMQQKLENRQARLLKRHKANVSAMRQAEIKAELEAEKTKVDEAEKSGDNAALMSSLTKVNEIVRRMSVKGT